MWRNNTSDEVAERKGMPEHIAGGQARYKYTSHPSHPSVVDPSPDIDLIHTKPQTPPTSNHLTLSHHHTQKCDSPSSPSSSPSSPQHPPPRAHGPSRVVSAPAIFIVENPCQRPSRNARILLNARGSCVPGRAPAGARVRIGGAMLELRRDPSPRWGCTYKFKEGAGVRCWGQGWG